MDRHSTTLLFPHARLGQTVPRVSMCAVNNEMLHPWAECPTFLDVVPCSQLTSPQGVIPLVPKYNNNNMPLSPGKKHGRLFSRVHNGHQLRQMPLTHSLTPPLSHSLTRTHSLLAPSLPRSIPCLRCSSAFSTSPPGCPSLTHSLTLTLPCSFLIPSLWAFPLTLRSGPVSLLLFLINTTALVKSPTTSC